MTRVEAWSDSKVDSEATLIENELKRAKGNSITILCGGPTGSGKSTLLNNAVGVPIPPFKVDESLTCCSLEPCKETYMLNGTEVILWDTPGLGCGLETDQAHLKTIREKCKGFDIFLFCVKVNVNSVLELLRKESALFKFTKAFGPKLWENAVIALTFANHMVIDIKKEASVVDIETTFQKRIDQWKSHIEKALSNAGVEQSVIRKIPFQPSGFTKRGQPVHLPGNEYWLSELFQKIKAKADEKKQILIVRSHVTKKEKISHGAYGVVYKGIYHGDHIAIKEPHEVLLEGGTTIDDLKREVACMTTVCHPNIVRFIGAVFDDQPIPMIILELMDMNLRSKYNEAAISKNLTLKIFQDIACALHYLHEFREPIIHRDLSAPNVLLQSLPSGQYIAKVSDLGSANLAKFAKTAGRGAIIYSAPEMFPPADPYAQCKKYTVKVDTFSYGILLCEVIVRKQPDPDRRREMLSKAAQEWGDMHVLIMNCIKVEPTERPAMSQILTTLSEIEKEL